VSNMRDDRELRIWLSEVMAGRNIGSAARGSTRPVVHRTTSAQSAAIGMPSASAAASSVS